MLNQDFFITQFNSALNNIDKRKFDKAGLLLYTGIVLDSVVIKVYKPGWSNNIKEPLTAKSRIFFSVWINNKTIEENKLYYNIHALKLRELPGHTIQSRDFAERFRSQFKSQQKDWPNVNIDFGPLTLMEGWKTLNNDTIQLDIIQLVKAFLNVSPIIDKVLSYYSN